MPSIRAVAVLLLAIAASGVAEAADVPADAPPTAPYLLAGAPTFDMTIVIFRERYNQHNPALPIAEFRAIDSHVDGVNLTRAASKINATLYASTALEKGSGKIKTLQLTYLPVQGPGEKTARAIALDYMAALLREFEPALTLEQSNARVSQLLSKGQGSLFFQRSVGAVRYVVSDNGDKGLTFAIEPVKLALAEP